MFDIKVIHILTQVFRLSSSCLTDWLLPASCLLCGDNTHDDMPVCQPCQLDLPILPHHCFQCAQFLPTCTSDVVKCGICLNNPPGFAATYALFPYEPPIIQWIIRLKFHHQLHIARALGKMLSHHIQSRWYAGKALPDVIIPVPLHPSRLRERGFNQALEIAKPVAADLRLRLDRTGIRRIRHTAAQSSLPAASREENIKNAFTVTRQYSGQVIALVDDVITTGHTLRECSRLLLRQGAARVDAWCCARRG
ncbi:Orotate phosphoribosyltransferase [Aquicella siphonis]|uniref:Orotate phosphoribosyltransferase n=1 Tax=Aquicella siphonis TaxID=254247 RepID=A0A5E4PDT7_9COXI|nr:ComF family protein [Aquicella siphonis]VVC75110.1 Orotate phosphoribosyltransferase [Aquicella siphonis]